MKPNQLGTSILSQSGHYEKYNIDKWRFKRKNTHIIIELGLFGVQHHLNSILSQVLDKDTLDLLKSMAIIQKYEGRVTKSVQSSYGQEARRRNMFSRNFFFTITPDQFT